MNAICLVLDKRWDYFYNYIKPAFKEKFDIDVQRFLVGDGSIKTPYDYIDNNDELPCRFDKSIQYETWFRRPNAYNAWKSHRLIFEKAVQQGWEKFLLLEDDVVITDDYTEVFGTNLDKVSEILDFDMMYLGSYNAIKRGRLISSNLVSLPRMSECGGFHAVILDRKVIKRLLELPPYGPYDWMASQWIHGNYNCYAVHPSIIVQNSGFSFVENCFLDKPSRYL